MSTLPIGRLGGVGGSSGIKFASMIVMFIIFCFENEAIRFKSISCSPYAFANEGKNDLVFT